MSPGPGVMNVVSYIVHLQLYESRCIINTCIWNKIASLSLIYDSTDNKNVKYGFFRDHLKSV